MSLTRTKATCNCGASIETAFTGELNDWLNRHDKCLKQELSPYEIGRKLYRDGLGISDVWSAVKTDGDMAEAFRGYTDEQKEQDGRFRNS